MKSREVPYGTIDIARVLPLKTWWFSIAIDCLLQMGYSYKASKNCMVGGDRRCEKPRCRTFGSCLPSGDWTLQWKGAIKASWNGYPKEETSQFGNQAWRWICVDWRFYCFPRHIFSVFTWLNDHQKNHQFSIWTRVDRLDSWNNSIRNLWWFWSVFSAFVWCFNPPIFDVEIPICLMLRCSDAFLCWSEVSTFCWQNMPIGSDPVVS